MNPDRTGSGRIIRPEPFSSGCGGERLGAPTGSATGAAGGVPRGCGGRTVPARAYPDRHGSSPAPAPPGPPGPPVPARGRVGAVRWPVAGLVVQVVGAAGAVWFWRLVAGRPGSVTWVTAWGAALGAVWTATMGLRAGAAVDTHRGPRALLVSRRTALVAAGVAGAGCGLVVVGAAGAPWPVAGSLAVAAVATAVSHLWLGWLGARGTAGMLVGAGIDGAGGLVAGVVLGAAGGSPMVAVWAWTATLVVGAVAGHVTVATVAARTGGRWRCPAPPPRVRPGRVGPDTLVVPVGLLAWASAGVPQLVLAWRATHDLAGPWGTGRTVCGTLTGLVPAAVAVTGMPARWAADPGRGRWWWTVAVTGVVLGGLTAGAAGIVGAAGVAALSGVLARAPVELVNLVVQWRRATGAGLEPVLGVLGVLVVVTGGMALVGGPWALVGIPAVAVVGAAAAVTATTPARAPTGTVGDR